MTTVDTTTHVDTAALADCLDNLGAECDDCGAAWNRRAFATRGGSRSRTPVRARANCPECGAQAEISTHVSVDMDFVVGGDA